MARTSDWGENKQNQTYRLTPTAIDGLDNLAQSLGITSTELLERIGRGAKDEVMQKSLWGVLTGPIMLLQNRRVKAKTNSHKGATQ